MEALTVGYQWLLAVFSSITNEFGNWGVLGISIVGLYTLRIVSNLFRRIFKGR